MLRQRAMEAVFDQLSEEEDESLLLLRDSFWSRGDDHLKSILRENIGPSSSTMPENIRWLASRLQYPVKPALRQSVSQDLPLASALRDLLEKCCHSRVAAPGRRGMPMPAALRQQEEALATTPPWEAFDPGAGAPALKGNEADACGRCRQRKHASEIVARWEEETPR